MSKNDHKDRLNSVSQSKWKHVKYGHKKLSIVHSYLLYEQSITSCFHIRHFSVLISEIIQCIFVIIFTHCFVPTYRDLFRQHWNQIIVCNLSIILIHIKTFYSKRLIRCSEIEYVHIQSCFTFTFACSKFLSGSARFSFISNTYLSSVISLI